MDVDNEWTNRISTKYLPRDDDREVRQRRDIEPRVALHLRPEAIVAVGTHPDLLPPR